MTHHSVALSGDRHDELKKHLLRTDGQEDICLATYTVSTGRGRVTRLIGPLELPRDGERAVHGNVSFTGQYVLRVAALAAEQGHGVAVLHSHPCGSGWQGLSPDDTDAESGFATLVHQVTGLPLLGMTLAGIDESWSARMWENAGPRPSPVESVRVVGPRMSFSWNEALRPTPPVHATQHRSASAWGDLVQSSIARSRILVVGAGSVGLDIVPRLAAAGVGYIGVTDIDRVEWVNLDRLIGATRNDARLSRRKVNVAARLARRAATARPIVVEPLPMSICSPEGLKIALDFDVIFCCVDRPWPRAVLNNLAYADLIPVIDGGISIDVFDDGQMRNATWRAHTLVPGRPCLTCSRQLDVGQVRLDKQGLLDDPAYIRAAGREPMRGGANVATLSASVSGALLSQFTSLIAGPAGMGVPSPLRYNLAPHVLEHLRDETKPFCPVELGTGQGDGRVDLTGTERTLPPGAASARKSLKIYFVDAVDGLTNRLRRH